MSFYYFLNFRQACYYLSQAASDNLMSGIDSAVACGLKADGARLAVTVTKTEFDAVKAAIGYQTTDSGTGRVWMGKRLFFFISNLDMLR